ncbi:MAG TPA: type 4a pilus biogenesis protein PilO [Xanthomonadales bacterium]|nr:type 4a pilus biogenesis protein PilO [Xanthomonadales bacterium]
MKIPKNFFDNLSANKYRAYLKLLPNMQKENTRIITTLILTFSAMTFFGIFAINPTLSTIVKLRKQLSDSELVYSKLKTKIQNLSTLQQQYNLLESELPIIQEAIPDDPNAPTLLGLVLGLAQEKKITISALNVSEVQLTRNNEEANFSYKFSLVAGGSYEELMDFTKELTNISRIVTIESIAVTKATDSNNLVLNLGGVAYFRY